MHPIGRNQLDYRTVFLIQLVLALGLFYPGLGLVLPLMLGLSTYDLVLCNLVGVVLAFVLVLAWTGVIFDAAERRHLVDWTTELRDLGADEFELLSARCFAEKVGTSKRPEGSMPPMATSISS